MRALYLVAVGVGVSLTLWGLSGGGFGLPAVVAGGALGALVELWLRSGARRDRDARIAGELAELRARVRRLETGATHDAHQSARPESDVPRPTPTTPAPIPPREPVAQPTTTTVAPPTPPPPPSTSVVDTGDRSRVGFDVERFAARAWAALVGWFTTGNVPVKVGVIVSFFGVGFLLKWAVDRELLRLPIEFRLVGIALAGAAMWWFGWRVRERKRVYGLSLQGGGVGIVYLTGFAALRLYGLISPLPAFGALVALTGFTGWLAVAQRARILAVLGLVGGFLAPILTSTGSGNHVALFGYYLALNLAILGIAWFRAWRQLNLIGFAFTYVIGWAWAARYYEPSFVDSTLPFVWAHFLLYVGVAMLFARRRAPKLNDYVDGTLVFATPVITFAMLAKLLEATEYGLAISALAAAAVYAAGALWLRRHAPPHTSMLVEAFAALAVAFGTLSIPLAFDARWTSAAWALEGAALIWVGSRQSRLGVRAFGVVLVAAAGIAFFRETLAPRSIAVLNGDCLGMLMIAVSAYLGSCLLSRQRDSSPDRFASIGLMVWGSLWWFAGGLHELELYVPTSYELATMIAFVALSCAAGVWLARRLDWSAIAWPARLSPLVLLGFALIAILSYEHAFANAGWLSWPVAVAALWWMIARLDDDGATDAGWLHAPLCWLVMLIGLSELRWLLARADASSLWRATAMVAAVCVVVFAVSRRWIGGPVERHRAVYLTAGIGPPLALAVPTILAFNLTPADPAPLPYLPLVNPLDLVGALLLVVLGAWLYELRDREPMLADTTLRARVAAVAIFALLTASVVRTVHHWGGVAWDSRLTSSIVVQATLSLFWGVLGLTAMIGGAAWRRRDVWFTGAALMGVVVVKLFLVDLVGSGTLSRVFSFIGVGVLLLVVGYFAGVPPRVEDDRRGR